MAIDVLDFALELISKRSISGETDEGAIELCAGTLKKMGFKNTTENFSGDGSYNVLNLYSEYGSGGKNLCFAGHTDVVPPGDERSWSVPPFSPKVVNGVLIGRGAVDMKGSIAAWISAVSEFLEANKNFNKGKLSLLITGDEEADSVNGTVKMLKSITAKGVKIDSCIVGEPTNPERLGEMMKIGRRGSISFTITVQGVQGHVAYPKKANNPTTILVRILSELTTHKLDSGNEFFEPSNLEVTSIDVNNPTANLIPEKASARLNIRFNNEHTGEKLAALVRTICAKHSDKFEIETRKGACESFLSEPGNLAYVVEGAAGNILGIFPAKSTTGGTSDARFIKDYAEVVEFGLINQTAHKVDEQVALTDLTALKNIYRKVIENYFS